MLRSFSENVNWNATFWHYGSFRLSRASCDWLDLSLILGICSLLTSHFNKLVNVSLLLSGRKDGASPNLFFVKLGLSLLVCPGLLVERFSFFLCLKLVGQCLRILEIGLVLNASEKIRSLQFLHFICFNDWGLQIFWSQERNTLWQPLLQLLCNDLVKAGTGCKVSASSLVIFEFVYNVLHRH